MEPLTPDPLSPAALVIIGIAILAFGALIVVNIIHLVGRLRTIRRAQHRPTPIWILVAAGFAVFVALAVISDAQGWNVGTPFRLALAALIVASYVAARRRPK